MLRLLGGTCSAEPVDVGKTTEIPADVIWADLLDPTLEEERMVEAAIGLDVPTREELQEIEPSSRLYERKGALFVTASVLHGVTAGKPDTDPVGFVLTDTTLVTVRYIDPRPFVAVAEQLCAEPEFAGNAAAVLLRLFDAIVDRLADELETAARDIEALSGGVFEPRSAGGRRRAQVHLEHILMRLGRVQRILAEVRESALSTSRALGFLAGRLSGTDHKSQLESLQADVKGLLDHDSFLSDNLAFLLNAALGMISLEQNSVMKIFSVFAVVLMPPTLIAGIYGMNFRHMPELDWTMGYPFALGLILLSAVVPYIVARRSGWL